MSQLDQFESLFRSAIKELFEFKEINLKNILLITDLPRDESEEYSKQIKSFISILKHEDQRKWTIFDRDISETASLEKLLYEIDELKPDLICTYRNLYSEAWQFPYSLGEHLDVMLQKVDIPILVMPHPKAKFKAEHALQNTNQVMVITDQNSINNDLINYAGAFTDPKGTLYLTHVEDAAIFERYMEVISKIGMVDTNEAQKAIREQLLKEPQDYFNSCINVFKEAGKKLQVDSWVIIGDALKEYLKHIQEMQLDLLVMNSKDDRQDAMHSVAYPLVIELRQIPLLLL